MKRHSTQRDESRNRQRRLSFQKMEARRLLAADPPLGATPVDTGEFLLGTVTVTPVFFESDGSIDPNTENWTEGEIEATLEKIRESVDWWSDLLATQQSVHTLDFVIDRTYADTPVETGYEPIARSSDVFQRYVGDWLTDLGYGDAPSIERAVHLFNDGQRREHETDWAFTIFVVDSSDDADGFFASGVFNGAFAYPGGLFYVVPSGRPVSTFSHEMGHIFWARDEYPGAGSWTDTRGYYNGQNLNASDNPTPGFVQQISIMRGGSIATQAYNELVSPPETLAMLGWRDSDGDGIFDVLDVPLELNAIGYLDNATSQYHLKGSAAVDTLENQNSSGPQSDITLAKISEIQYRLDDGDWVAAISPDAAAVDFDLQLDLGTTFSQIEWRAIDTSTGVTSDVLAGSPTSHVLSAVGGVLFLDPNANESLDINEALIAGATVTVRHQDGRALFQSDATAASMTEGEIATVNGLTFSTDGVDLSGRAGVFESQTSPGRQVFQAHSVFDSGFHDTWGVDQQLTVASQEDVGRVEVDFTGTDTGTYGLRSGSYARIEAFDRAGQRIDRVTSHLALAGQDDRLVIQDPAGRIASVKIYGHAETEILISAIRFGQLDQVVTDASGAFLLSGLADGAYTLDFVAPNLTYGLPAEGLDFTIGDGSTSSIYVDTERIDSPRYNSVFEGDVNGDDTLTARDALAIINDLGVLGNRTLGPDETEGLDVDANNDGVISAIDALTVINLLAQQSSGEGEQTTPVESGASESGASESGASESDASALWDTSARSLAAGAVDRVFQQSEEPENRLLQGDDALLPGDSDLKMWNYAGQRTTRQSPVANRSDSRSEADLRSDTTDEFSSLETDLNRDSPPQMDDIGV